MSRVATLLLAATCWTSVLPQDESVDGVYIPERAVPRELSAVESTIARTNPYHPLVRFRTIEVRPAYFYVLDKQAPQVNFKPEEPRMRGSDLVQLLTSIYQQEYNESPPKEFSKSTIRFGVIR